MSKPNSDKHLEEDICIHIFTVSSAMVGVCLTVIGLIPSSLLLGKAIRSRTICWLLTPSCFWWLDFFLTGRSAPGVFAECIAWNGSRTGSSFSR